MEAFPAFFPLQGARVVIAGEGEGAEAKARLLAGSPAQIERVRGEAARSPEAYAGAALAFVASPDPDFCRAAAEAAKQAGVAVNVVDHAELCDFHTPAIIDRGQVVAAIGTGGAAPIVSALLRAELEAKIPAGLGRLAELFGQMRQEIVAAFPDLSRRRAFLRALLSGAAAEAADAGDLAKARQLIRAELGRGVAALGCVWLIAAPASRDELSLRAARALAEADTLVPGEGVAPDVAVLARRDAPRRALAGAGADFLANEAAEGRQTVVLANRDALGPLAGRLDGLGAAYRRLEPAPAA
ncbi:MAG TPA: bifunctional precorrin-2 dehydrogenase/sirohydrochlorin ferrochelatase [Caulobacteraceae bacterium]|nr:bifunctional precorrin-2 dehydrogenase/sirohydrochlorin ferrochelatase [Caulobacteraceae bacterium]